MCLLLVSLRDIQFPEEVEIFSISGFVLHFELAKSKVQPTLISTLNGLDVPARFPRSLLKKNCPPSFLTTSTLLLVITQTPKCAHEHKQYCDEPFRNALVKTVASTLCDIMLTGTYISLRYWQITSNTKMCYEHFSSENTRLLHHYVTYRVMLSNSNVR